MKTLGKAVIATVVGLALLSLHRAGFEAVAVLLAFWTGIIVGAIEVRSWGKS